MNKKFQSALSDPRLLWAATGLASMVLLGFLSSNNGDSAAFMVMSGLVVSFFTKNMTVILGAATMMSILYSGSNFRKRDRDIDVMVEGFESKERKRGMKDSDVAGPLKGGESVEATIANLEEILGSGSIDTMSATTKRLLEQQNALGQKLENIMPLVQQGMGMLEKVGGTEGIDKMLKSLERFQPRRIDEPDTTAYKDKKR